MELLINLLALSLGIELLVGLIAVVAMFVMLSVTVFKVSKKAPVTRNTHPCE